MSDYSANEQKPTSSIGEAHGSQQVVCSHSYEAEISEQALHNTVMPRHLRENYAITVKQNGQLTVRKRKK